MYVHDRKYELHRSWLLALSPTLASLLEESEGEGHDQPVFRVPEGLCSIEGFEELQTCLESDIQLQGEYPLDRICALVRVTAPDQLHIPTLHVLARTKLEGVVDPNRVGALDEEATSHAEEALSLSTHYNIPSIRKRLLYTVATISHFEEGPSSHPSLPTNVTNLCASIQEQLIAHFTPILFTVATASHMACTDVFAEQWMPLVIGPALESSGLCRPVETLRRIQTVQWESHGLCETCCAEKREEWEDEIQVVWRKIDEWI